MAGITNRGKKLLLQYACRTTVRPTNYYVALWNPAAAPTADTNIMSDGTQITAGNGYTSGGYSLTPGDTDFDVNTEDDGADTAKVQIKDIVWTASGGNIPLAGSGARYAVLTDDNATPANRQVLAYWDLTSERTVSDTQTLTLQNCELDLTEA